MARRRLKFNEFESHLEGSEEWVKEQLGKRKIGLGVLLCGE